VGAHRRKKEKKPSRFRSECRGKREKGSRARKIRSASEDEKEDQGEDKRYTITTIATCRIETGCTPHGKGKTQPEGTKGERSAAVKEKRKKRGEGTPACSGG